MGDRVPSDLEAAIKSVDIPGLVFHESTSLRRNGQRSGILYAMANGHWLGTAYSFGLELNPSLTPQQHADYQPMIRAIETKYAA